MSDRLKSSGIKGGLPTNLWKFREFYHAYPEIPQTVSVEFTEPTRDRQEISETASRKLATSLSGSLSTAQIRQTLSVTLAGRFTLGWSHYVTLLTIDNAEERRFYELEAVATVGVCANWSGR